MFRRHLLAPQNALVDNALQRHRFSPRYMVVNCPHLAGDPVTDLTELTWLSWLFADWDVPSSDPPNAGRGGNVPYRFGRAGSGKD